MGPVSYGLTLFIFVPILAGAVAAWLSRVRSVGHALGAGAMSTLTGCLLVFFFAQEGAICLAMALPLLIPLGMFGGWAAFQIMRRRSYRRDATTMLLFLPFGLGTYGWDLHAKPDVFQVHSSVEINAPAETVWHNVVSFRDLPKPDEWYFKAGVAYPMRARIEGSGPGAVRYCEFSTGPFVEPIDVWDEPRLLRFHVTQNPEPMHELSIYKNVEPKHLHGYLISKQGEFHLVSLGPNRTRLEGTTWYQHGLWPAHYWRWWSDAIIHRIHLRVMNHIRELSENQASLP